MPAHKKAPRAGGARINPSERHPITARQIAEALKARRSGKGWQARCPAHDDRKPSLSISEGDDGRPLVRCHTGCSQDAVIEALRARGLWPTAGGSGNLTRYPESGASPPPWEKSGPPPADLSHPELGPPDRLFEVRDRRGRLFGVHARWNDPRGEGKEMRWWRCDLWALGGIKSGEAPLYGAHKLGGWDSTAPLILTEGQPAAEALWTCELQAVASVTGAGAVPSERVLDDLTGWRGPVVLWADNDERGREHMRGVAAILRGRCPDLRGIFTPPEAPPKGDAADYIEALDARETAEIREGLLALFGELGPYRPPAEGKPDSGPTVVCMADVEPEEIRWLWYPRIARRKVTILEGDPGVGKSFVTAAIAAALSSGGGLPDCESFEPCRVLMLTAEDGLGDTLRPRLDSLGADVGNVFACETPIDLSSAEGRDFARRKIEEHRPALVTIDPIVAYVGGRTDTHRANQVRSVLAPLAALAAEFGCAALAVRHLSKGAAARSIYRGQGSIDFTAAARSVLLTGYDPSDEERRALLQIKTNLGPTAPALGFEIPEGRFRWTGDSSLTAADLLGGEGSSEEKSAEEEAREFLVEVLGEGRLPSTDVKKEAKAAGIAERTLWNAKRKLGVKAEREGFGPGAVWHWSLAETS